MTKLIRHRRLGLKMGLTPQNQATGWCLFEERGRLPESRIEGDPFDLALKMVPLGEHVDLIAYRDDASFAHSQAARDGLTRSEHIGNLLSMAAFLRKHGRSASLKFVTVEP